MSCGTCLSSRDFHRMQTGHQRAYRQQFRSSCQQQLVWAGWAQRVPHDASSAQVTTGRAAGFINSKANCARLIRGQLGRCKALLLARSLLGGRVCGNAIRICPVRHRTLGNDLKPKTGCANAVREVALHMSTSLSVGFLSLHLCSCKHRGNHSLCHVHVNPRLSSSVCCCCH